VPGLVVDVLQMLDAVDVRSCLRKLDRLSLGTPTVDVALTRVVGGKHEPLVAVLAEEVVELPGAVADVDLRIE